MLTTLARRLSGLPSLLFALLALALALPVLAVLGSWLQWSGESASILREMAATVLPDYALTTLGLCLMVAVGVTVLGLATAALVTLFDFPGRGVFEWLLLLPLAMPAYVVAYAYTDFLQFSGPLQVALRETLGLQGRLWPDVRSVWGAALVFTLSLYPYVYLLARTALVERASGLMEAARLLGAPLSRRIREIALPLARPAVAAGVAFLNGCCFCRWPCRPMWWLTLTPTFCSSAGRSRWPCVRRWVCREVCGLMCAAFGALRWCSRSRFTLMCICSPAPPWSSGLRV